MPVKCPLSGIYRLDSPRETVTGREGVSRQNLRPPDVRSRMAQSVDLLVRSRAWDKLGERHQAMVRAIAYHADRADAHLDEVAWQEWLRELGTAAKRAKRSRPPDVASLAAVIEEGYRRVMFAIAKEVQILEGMDTDTKLIPMDGDDIDAIREAL